VINPEVKIARKTWILPDGRKKAICISFLSAFRQRIGKAGKHRMGPFGLISGKGDGYKEQ